MTRPSRQALIVAVWAIVTIALAAVGLVRIGGLSGKVHTVEHRIERRLSTVERRIVELPCTRGDEAKCRRFLAILLSQATAEQLERLLAAKRITLTPAKIRELERFLGNHHPPKRRRRLARQPRKGVVPGEKEKPKEKPGKSRRPRRFPWGAVAEGIPGERWLNGW
jgi:hypothetical protein